MRAVCMCWLDGSLVPALRGCGAGPGVQPGRRNGPGPVHPTFLLSIAPGMERLTCHSGRSDRSPVYREWPRSPLHSQASGDGPLQPPEGRPEGKGTEEPAKDSTGSPVLPAPLQR